jgi:hypothetical protein
MTKFSEPAAEEDPDHQADEAKEEDEVQAEDTVTKPGGMGAKSFRTRMSKFGRNIDHIDLNMKRLVWIGVALFVLMIACTFVVSFLAADLAKDTTTTPQGTLQVKGSNTMVATRATGRRIQVTLDPEGFRNTSQWNYSQWSGGRRLQAGQCHTKLGDADRTDVMTAWEDVISGVVVTATFTFSKGEDFIVSTDSTKARKQDKGSEGVVYTGGGGSRLPRCLD